MFFPFVTFFFFMVGWVLFPRFLSFSVAFLVPWPFDPVARRRHLPSALLAEDAGRRKEGALWV